VSQVEGKTNFSRRLKQFDGLTRLTPTPFILRQIYATANILPPLYVIPVTYSNRHVSVCLSVCLQGYSKTTGLICT